MLADVAAQSWFNRVCHLNHVVIAVVPVNVNALTACLAAMPELVTVVLVFVVSVTFITYGFLRRIWRNVTLFAANMAAEVYFWLWHVIIPICLIPRATKAASSVGALGCLSIG